MKKLIIFLTILLALGTSCEDFLTINEKNPNSASYVEAKLMLPAALNGTARIVNDPGQFEFVNLWYGWWSISSGYQQSAVLTQYNPLNTNYQTIWSNTYLNLQNYDYIEKISTGTQNKPYRAVAKIMKAYLYQILVDTYGNIPYSQALKTDEGILKPAYDPQQTIYEDLVAKLDSAINLIETTPIGAAELGDNDIVYHGDMSLWKKFANTIKLRLLVNQSGMTGRTAYITSKIATTPHSVDDYIGAGEGAWSNPGYLKTAGKMNPFWERFYKQDDSPAADGLNFYVAGQDMCDFLTETNDPRTLRIFAPYAGTSIAGNYYGTLTLRAANLTSELGPGLLQSYDQPSPLMTEWESLFLQAEAIERGILTGNSKDLYQQAVTESIIYFGSSAAEAAAYVASESPLADYDIATNKVKLILTQKWCSLIGLSAMPVWTDYRRSGFPDFLHWSASPAKKNLTPPVRLLYPQSEININNENVLAQGTINLFTSKIFWQNR